MGSNSTVTPTKVVWLQDLCSQSILCVAHVNSTLKSVTNHVHRARLFTFTGGFHEMFLQIAYALGTLKIRFS